MQEHIFPLNLSLHIIIQKPLYQLKPEFLCLDYDVVRMCGTFVFSSLGTVLAFQLSCFAYLVHKITIFVSQIS